LISTHSLKEFAPMRRSRPARARPKAESAGKAGPPAKDAPP